MTLWAHLAEPLEDAPGAVLDHLLLDGLEEAGGLRGLVHLAKVNVLQQRVACDLDERGLHHRVEARQPPGRLASSIRLGALETMDEAGREPLEVELIDDPTEPHGPLVPAARVAAFDAPGFLVALHKRVRVRHARSEDLALVNLQTVIARHEQSAVRGNGRWLA